jgi:hypothetical protein
LGARLSFVATFGADDRNLPPLNFVDFQGDCDYAKRADLTFFEFAR